MPRIQNDCINTIEIKKSKFITYLHRTQDEQEAKDFLKTIKKEHPNANHHCTYESHPHAFLDSYANHSSLNQVPYSFQV